MNEIPNILEPKEKVEWDGKPNIIPYFISSILLIIIFNGVVIYWSRGNVKGTILSLVVIGFSALFILLTYLGYRVTHYAITNKRVIIQTGIIGRDFKSIDYDKMQSVTVKVGLLGVIFKVGDVLFFTGETYMTKRGKLAADYDTFRYVNAPYDILKMVQTKLSSRKEKLYGGKA